MNAHNAINYIEMPVADIPATKQFFGQVFGWEFMDYCAEYTCFTNAGIAGGFSCLNRFSIWLREQH
ncbi:Glyoxalase family protein [Shewanella violacea]|uniref:Glyoxalase/Bleomycin resistance-like N-terminal domain-containing protein n=1 Tax=Shewanella violacea (strain JCM 10179 / CIP 106290 / LMG 19151 / DSS12) TaxID=637905 RepID=D4ZJ93_SHEVD|nr:hypothetical protein SVI_1771 [Shewanella violacea DSS12]